jgi:TonB family protein
MTVSSSSLLRTPRTIVPVGLSSVLALSATFLAVGVLGMVTYELPEVSLRDSLLEVDAQSMQPLDSLLAELPGESSALPDAAAQTTESSEPPPMEAAVSPSLEPVELPELVHAMTPEDVFAVPPAPLVEDLAKVLEPKPQSTPPRIITTSRRTSTSSAASSGSALSAAVGNGKAGAPAGRCPKPPYPSFARSARMTGTVKLRIVGNMTGHVEQVSVVSTCGFSALDEYTANYVRKYWHPGAGVKIQPISYRLN